jgi:hypothetical protein
VEGIKIEGKGGIGNSKQKKIGGGDIDMDVKKVEAKKVQSDLK